MSHTDPEILALRALGETAGSVRDDEHAASCGQCRAELARLSEVVGLARAGGLPEPLETPPAAVWDQIAAAVGGSAVPSPVPAVPGRAGPLEPNGAGRWAHGAPRRASRGRPGRPAIAAAGLAAGLIIGIGGTAGVVQLTKAPAAGVIAQVELNPLPQFPQWQGASGTAVMRSTAGQQVIGVTLNAPRRTGFYEVWLLARNGVSMISLGDLNAGHTGTFAVPPGTDLRNYSRIDVSLQPFDGSTVHVKASVVRGSLPAAALGA